MLNLSLPSAAAMAARLSPASELLREFGRLCQQEFASLIVAPGFLNVRLCFIERFSRAPYLFCNSNH